jgi:hypothetical protein
MTSITTLLRGAVRRLWSYLAPLRDRVEPLQVVADLCLRSRRELVVENATLRHQVSVLRRTGGRPRLGLSDRLRLLTLQGLAVSQGFRAAFSAAAHHICQGITGTAILRHDWYLSGEKAAAPSASTVA